MNSPTPVKNIVEAALLAANKAVSLDKLLTLFAEEDDIDNKQVYKAIEELMKDYQDRGIELIKVSSGYRFQVAELLAPWVSRLWEEKPQKYSRALLETLALVAYRQPVTRGEIEDIRGVSVSSQIIRTLVEREWVRIIAYKEVPGKPALYATTKSFLDYFGLKKLDELPTLAEIRDLDVIDAELGFAEKEKKEDKHTVTENDSDLLSENKDSSDQNERIDIDEALNALKETYQKIDALDHKKEL